MTALQRADEIAARRPVLPYRSVTVDGLSGVTVEIKDGRVLVDGLAHSPRAALDLSIVICNAANKLIAAMKEGSRG